MEETSTSTNNEAIQVGEKWVWGGGTGTATGIGTHWWCAIASTAQLGWGIRAFKKGYAGECRMMPLKAFAIASLFVGSLGTASFGALRASGIHTVEDLKELGANIRRGLGVPPRNTR